MCVVGLLRRSFPTKDSLYGQSTHEPSVFAYSVSFSTKGGVYPHVYPSFSRSSGANNARYLSSTTIFSHLWGFLVLEGRHVSGWVAAPSNRDGLCEWVGGIRQHHPIATVCVYFWIRYLSDHEKPDSLMLKASDFPVYCLHFRDGGD